MRMYYKFLYLFLHLDRSEGGSSIHDGSIEVMVHRRLTYDDRLGAHEPLNETAYGEGLVVRGRHSLVLKSPQTSALYHRVHSQTGYMHPLATFALTPLSYNDYSTAYRQTWSAINDQLPLNVHLLTLDQTGDKTYLARVEHFFELNEDDTYSHPQTINLQSIFQSIGTISTMTELTLSANLELSSLHRLNWTTNAGESSFVRSPSHVFNEKNSLGDTNVHLNPMQIRTFQVTIN